MGVGVPFSCEAVVHSINSVLSDASLDPNNKWILQVDFSNAFNSVDRASMFDEVRSHVPSMAAWIESCYGFQPNLHLGAHSVISSCCGVQQGDPLGPLCFALALHPIVERIAEEVPGLLVNVWYLDDGTLCGSSDDLLKALKIIEEDGPARGLLLNRSKSSLFVPSQGDLSVSSLPSDIPVAREGFLLLGAPVGSPDFIAAEACKRVSKIKVGLDLLSTLNDSQMEYVLLCSCLSLPKFVFLLRTCFPEFISNATEALDSALYDSVVELTGSPLSEWVWKKATLPVSMGGLGIRLSSLHAPAAFISSVVQSGPLVSSILNRLTAVLLGNSVAQLAAAANHPEWTSLDNIDVIIIQQSTLSRAIDQALFDSVYAQSPDARSRAILLSTSIRHAGDWLNVVPSPALGLHLSDWEFRLCTKYWLGIPMADDGFPCPVCGADSDSMGDHFVTCRGNGDLVHRHDSVRDILFSVAQSAALAPRKEVPSLIPNSSSRPADLYLPHWRRGRPTACDLTIISPVQCLTLDRAAEVQGYAITVAEERKLRAHESECHQNGITFVPLAAESLGGWSRLAMDTIREFGKLQALRCNLPPAHSIRHLFQRLSITLWRGNANSWASHVPILPPSEDGME